MARALRASLAMLAVSAGLAADVGRTNTRSVPEQVHLALGKTDDSMTVAWVEQDVVTQPIVQWSESPSMNEGQLSIAIADFRAFTQDLNRTWYSHVAIMSELKPHTKYFYRVGTGPSNFSPVFSFTHRRQRGGPDQPFQHIIFGDLGARCGFSLCTACTRDDFTCDAKNCSGDLSVGLVSEVDTADMMLHVGDFAYNLGDNGGTVGDQFMRNIEQLASRVPYMVSHGNHEDNAINLAHYIERFRSQPSNAVPSTFSSANGRAANTLYFSWDFGLVHYVSISTELWFGVTDTATTKMSQLEWLKKDLDAANKNRDMSPWIIVQGHRSVYCTCDGDCDGDAEIVRKDLEPLLFHYGVDFFINGHEHNYERTYPLFQGLSTRSTTDPKATMYIISGSAGSQELHEPFELPQPSWSAFRTNSFGYTRLFVYNSTHIHLQQVQTDPLKFPLSYYGRVIDDVWITQSSHGSFDPSLAPKGEAYPDADPLSDSAFRQHDHWTAMLNLDDNSGRRSDTIIREWRSKNDECAWICKLEMLMTWVNENLGGHTTQWENVTGDGSSDGAIFRWRHEHPGLQCVCRPDTFVV